MIEFLPDSTENKRRKNVAFGASAELYENKPVKNFLKVC